MDDNLRILVIFLSSALAVFLVLGIVALVKVIQILHHLKRISEKAEKLADQAEAVGEFFQRNARPLAIGRLLSNIAETVMHRGNNNKRKGKNNEEND